MPTWKRLEPQRSCRLRRIWLELGSPGVLLAVEADEAAEEEDRQADIGIPDEEDVEDGVAHGRTPPDLRDGWRMA